MVVQVAFIDGAEDLGLPTYATKGSAGADLRSAIDDTLHPGSIRMIPTGMRFRIQSGYEGQIRSRSGLTLKGIVVANSPGTIDSDFTGEVIVLLENTGSGTYYLQRGDRIAQLVIAKCEQAYFYSAETLSTTERGDNGFGSTGV
jgi:dUTP pyrophosphatase